MPERLHLPIPLDTMSSDTLPAFAILAIAVTLAGLAIIILFWKRKI